MNPVHKRILAFIVSIVTVIKIITMPVFASASAVGGSSIAFFFQQLLLGLGISSDIFDGASISDQALRRMAQEQFDKYKETGEYPNTFTTPDGRTMSWGEYMNYLTYEVASDQLSGGRLWYDFEELGFNIYDWVHSHDDDIVTSSTFDMNGAVAVLVEHLKDGFWDYQYMSKPCYIFNNGVLGFRGYFAHIVRNPDGSLYLSSSYGHIDVNGGLQSNEYYFYGDWRYEDGTQSETSDSYVKIIGKTEDGTKVTIDMLNPDGTATVDGVDVPVYVDFDNFVPSAIWELIQDLIDLWEKSIPVAPDTTQDLVDSVTDSIGSVYEGELSDYMIPTGILSVFPFCLPFDFVRGIQLLSSKPVAPVLEIPFDVPEFGAFKGYSTTLKIEFEKYDKYFSVFRWGIYLCFCFTLIFVSTKIVKGAGA